MKKVFSLVSSAVLALALLLPSQATAQNYKKITEQSTETSFKVKPAAPRTLQVHRKGTEAASATPSLRSAMQATYRISASKGLRAASTSFPDLRGSSTYGDIANGLYTISSDASVELVKSGIRAKAGGTALNGVYYYIDDYEIFGMVVVTVYALDAETGEELYHFSGDVENEYLDMAADPTSGIIYALGINAEGTSVQLLKVAITDGSITNTVVGDLPGFWNALACDAEGQLYATDQYSGDDVAEPSRLYKLDKLTATPTLVGSTGMYPYYSSSAAIDPRSGRMFWTVCPYGDECLLCEVNTATGAATLLGTFEGTEQVQGLYVKTPLAEDGAPASAIELTANFANGSLSGTIDFTAPATTFDGNPGSGSLSYEVSIEGTPVRNGSATWGETMSVPVALAASGEYNFSVVMSNAAGKSPVATTTAYVGMGVPVSTVATLNYFDGELQLAWTPVATTVGGIGYIDPASVTYTVTRFPADEVVYEGPATSFRETIEEPESLTQIYYTVVAHCGDLSSAAATSNAVALGSIIPPYTNDFSSPVALDGFTIIDANGDGKHWEVVGGQARMGYNSTVDMDDWMITPPIKLEGGKSYKITFEAQTNYYDERIEAKWGMQPTVAGMTETLVEPTELPADLYYSTPLELGDYITPAVTGVYYVGIHGISDHDMYWLYVDNLSISAPVGNDAPAAVTDFKALTDPDGAYKTTVTFKAPTLTYGGDPLTALTSIELKRDGTSIHTFSPVEPGQECSFVDEVGTEGTVTYTAIATNADGAGTPAEVSTFVGIDVPAAPTGVTLVESATEPGIVTVGWDAVTTDRNGQPINPSFVTYSVAYYDVEQNAWVDMKTGITGTSYTFRAVPEGEQDFVQYAVYSETAAGYEGAATDYIPVGQPYEGLDESFPDGHLAYQWAIDYATPNAKWTIYNDQSLSGMTSFDGDGGYAGMLCYIANGGASLISGKISLEGVQKPGVSLYVYSLGADDDNDFELYVREMGTEEWTSLVSTKVNQLAGEKEWGLVSASLEAFAGKMVQIRIAAVTQEYTYTFVDLIHVGSLLDFDLAATELTAPGIVAAGSPYTATAKVSNMGIKDVEAYTVELLADGATVATRTMGALAAGHTATVAFDLEMSTIATEAIELTALVKYSADENAENDESEAVTVTPRLSKLPRVTDLEGEEVDGVPTLTWTEPDLTASGAPTLTDFEDGTSWAQSYEGWTFVDVDNAEVGGFQNSNIPGIDPGTSKVSFLVWDAAGYNEQFGAHSGQKYLVAMYRYDDGTTDDWAISPELSGNAQTVTFFAKSYNPTYPEKIEMYYSTGSLDPADFIKVGETVEAVPGTWTEYSIEVPAGGKHFAVRSCATGSFLLMMDDFTYEPGVAAELSIVGYDVYRDGEKITAEPVGECEYADADATAGEHTYVVVTVYTNGNSAPSNAVTVAASGIADAVAAGISIEAGKGIITVTGAEGKLLTVAAADGKLYFNAPAAARQTVAAPAGIYVVKAGTRVAKVAVK